MTKSKSAADKAALIKQYEEKINAAIDAKAEEKAKRMLQGMTENAIFKT